LQGQPQSQLHGPNVSPLIHHFSTVVCLLPNERRLGSSILSRSAPMTAAADPPFAFDTGQARTPVPDPDVKGDGLGVVLAPLVRRDARSELRDSLQRLKQKLEASWPDRAYGGRRPGRSSKHFPFDWSGPE
jgi:hypothetical protein